MTASQAQRMDWLKEGKTVQVETIFYCIKDNRVQWSRDPEFLHYTPVNADGFFSSIFDITREATVYVEYSLKTWEALKEMQENGATIQSEWGCTYRINKSGDCVDGEGNETCLNNDEIIGKWKIVKKKEE